MASSSRKRGNDDHTGEKHPNSGSSSRKRSTEVVVLDSSDDDYHYQVRKRPKRRTCDDIEAEKGNKRAKHVLTVDLETTTDDFSSPISKMKARCNDKKKHLKTKRRGKEKPVWESSSSDDDAAEPFFMQYYDWFANVRVKKSDCYYPSSLQTTIRKVRQLKLTDQHLEAIKHTPFWFLIRSIREEDEDILMESTKKNEDDIRLLVRKFHIHTKTFRIGKKVMKLEKQDLVFIFGVRDGTVEINVPKRLKITPWMSRCFPDLFKKRVLSLR